MKRLLTILLSISSLVLSAQFTPQPQKVTEKFFPDPEVEINTPAFHRRGFTTYNDLIPYLNRAVDSHPALISYTYIGSSQKGRKIPMVKITKGEDDKDKLKVWMQGGLHGDEPASTEGLLFLIDRLLNDAELTPLLEKVVLHIVPMANIDGCNKLDRYAANGLDLNRDQTKLHAQESVFLKTAFTEFEPHVALDFHEYRPYRRDFARMSDWGVTNKYDVMFLYSGNLNVPEKLRKFTEAEFVNPARLALDEHGLSHHDYFTSTTVHGEIQFNCGATNPRSSATSYALSNCVASLIEVRGVDLGRASYKRRVFSTYTVALSYLYTAVDKADMVRSIVQTINTRHSPDVVVKAKRGLRGEHIPFIDMGTHEIIEMPSIVRDAWLATPTLQRPRPDAYYILPGHEAAVEKLRTLGLEVEELTTQISLEVDAYEVVKYRRDTYKYEAVHMQHVQAVTHSIKKTFPPGTFKVNIDQKNGNMLPELLEPETSSGFVAFAVFPTQMGAELPVYRFLNSKNP